MKILKATVSFTDAHLGKLLLCNVIEYKGKFWLVPEWIENKQSGKMKPARIICLENLPHQKLPLNSGKKYQFVLNQPIPRAVFFGQIPKETTFDLQVVENPDIVFDVPPILH